MPLCDPPRSGETDRNIIYYYNYLQIYKILPPSINTPYYIMYIDICQPKPLLYIDLCKYMYVNHPHENIDGY